MVLIYIDNTLLEELPEGRFDEMMRGCLAYADDMRAKGKLLDSQMLEDANTAKTMRVRHGQRTTVDGPFAEAKEVLGGFNLVEANSVEDALEMASHFPWASVGSVEVRPVRDIGGVRERVHAATAATDN
jgi:hypothetical protein